MNPSRRKLRFQNLDEVMPEVDRLLEGCTTVGSWTLAQTCWHLATVMRRVVDQPADTPSDPKAWIPEEKRREILESGEIPDGLPSPPDLHPPADLDPVEEARRLRDAVDHYKASAGPVIAHRLLGPLTKSEWDHIQRIHCAHHLSFLSPTMRA